MRKTIVGAIFAIASTSAIATSASDYIGPISDLVQTQPILVSGDNLKCEHHSNNRGYIPYEWSQAILVAPVFPRPILPHTTVMRYSDTGVGSADSLCQLVGNIKSRADQNGYINARVRIKAEIVLSPRYGDGCSRDLFEELTVTFTNGLVLKSTGSRLLSGGSNQRTNCFEQL